MCLFLHRQNEVTPEVKTLVEELKSIAPKDRKKVHCWYILDLQCCIYAACSYKQAASVLATWAGPNKLTVGLLLLALSQ